MRKLPARAYYISSPEDDTVLIALDVTVDINVIQWFDTTRGRAMVIRKVTEDDDNLFAFERADGKGGVYLFQPLTLDLYRAHVMQSTIGEEDFPDENTMLQALEQTKTTAW